MHIGFISWFISGIIYFSVSCVQPNASSETEFMKTQNDSSLSFFPATGQNKAVTVVSHGLNNKPSVMLPLVKYLNQLGSDVYLVKLFGHRSDSSNLKNLTEDIWLNETLNAYNQARERSEIKQVPLYFLGYSLGALVGQYMIYNSKGAVNFDRQVLLAPATALRSRSGFLKMSFILPGHWKLPSYTPEAYRANEGIQINVYKILFNLEEQIQQGGFSNLNLPTLLVMDEKDELVSYGKLNEFIDKYELTEYQMLTLDPSLEDRATKYHHMIIDEPTMGVANWELSKRKIEQFLFPDQ